jgi:ABC-2 type transport system ATP-binding protein
MSTSAVVVEDVHVRFGGVHALAGIDLAAPTGSTLAVLGHNGAGKTTLIRVLATLIRPDAGRALVDGFDVVREPDQVRRRIAVTGQYAGLDEYLTGRENLELVGRLRGLGTSARTRAGTLIDRLALDDVADRRVGELSGGSRRRIDLAASLVSEPSVLFLDEPTTGLDPSARNALWELVSELTADGTTVVLTTQYLEEADRLADVVVVLDHGRISARGTPAELKRLVGGKVVTATIGTADLPRLVQRPHDVRAADTSLVHISYSTADAESAARIVAGLTTQGVSFDDLAITSPTLDDVFAHLMLEGVPS